MSVEIANESGEPVDEPALAALARHLLERLGVHPLAELSVLLVDAGAMSHLNSQWMDESGPTDVLAFPMDELRPGGEDDGEVEPSLLGDVVLCPEVAQRQAAAAGHPTDDELQLLCTHGVLHLLGYDHAEPDEERKMFALQHELLTAWRSTRAEQGPEP
ncbi:MAG: rRNA maturation RNase YbeY [Actinomycetota bacterium]|nr:rRNA maturation RNase YbeY [Acidothermales bacterium]MDQ3432839.1 rRNA maturation RNase YbeY [Actinomycetota bacterium]